MPALTEDERTIIVRLVADLKDALRRARDVLGQPRPGRPSAVDYRPHVDVILNAWKAGEGTNAIAARVGMSPQAVRNLVCAERRRGDLRAVERPRGRPRKAASLVVKKPPRAKARMPRSRDRIVALHAKGLSVAQIAARVGWKRNSVSAALYRARLSGDARVRPAQLGRPRLVEADMGASA